MKILLTCPPMIGMIDEFRHLFEDKNIEVFVPEFTQVMTEDDLCDILPDYDGWIIGDDPATRRVFEAGKAGKLKAAVKWGVGVDNVDFAACKDIGLPIINTPGVFGREVADVALSYVLGLARETYKIDREIRAHNSWPKPAGISFWNKKAAVVGFGDIGRQTCKRLLALDLDVYAYDPFFKDAPEIGTVKPLTWPQGLDDMDFLIFTAPLNDDTYHMFNMDILPLLKKGVRVVNVGRGPLIQEAALLQSLKDGTVHSAGLDVFEIEPLQENSPLRAFDQCIFGSHNGSNSKDAVRHVSHLAVEKLYGFLDVT